MINDSHAQKSTTSPCQKDTKVLANLRAGRKNNKNNNKAAKSNNYSVWLCGQCSVY